MNSTARSLRALYPTPRLFSVRTLASLPRASAPWFVDAESIPTAFCRRAVPPHISDLQEVPPVPSADAPESLKALHAQLICSPFLDKSTVILSRAIPPPPGPPLPLRAPHGKRRRGGTYAGESMYDSTNGIWDWVVMAQVKEGTEDRGAIESVVRVVRKYLSGVEPSLSLAPKSRQQMESGWAMIDGGAFSVHILSKQARDKYFNVQRRDIW